MFFALSPLAYCGEPSRVELTDGSVINGEVVSLANGVYTVNSSAFGEIKIDAAKVSKIESVKPSLPSINGKIDPATIESYKQSLLNNKENVAALSGLAANPSIQDLAKDPQVVAAAKAGDIQALLNNKKFTDVVSDPDVQETIKKLKK